MNTTKATRDYIREAVKDCFENKGSWKFGTHATIIALANLVHDIDTLEARLEEYRKLLERAISAIKAKDQLLGCYRVGREPSTKLWGELEKVVHLLSEYAAMKEGKE